MAKITEAEFKQEWQKQMKDLLADKKK